MSSNQEIAQRLAHFSAHIYGWKNEAARLTLVVARSRQDPASEAELTALEKTAGAIYEDLASFSKTLDEIALKSPEAAAELGPVSDAIRLVLLEITELGIKLYSTHSGMPHGSDEAVS